MDYTEEIVEAESTENQTEEVVEAESTKEVSDVDIQWGADHPEDTMSDDLSIEEEVADSQDEETPGKTPVQLRIDTLTREKKELAAEKAHMKNTTDFLMQELSKVKNATAQAPPPPEEKEPVWETFEEKFADDPDKATREYLKASQSFELKKYVSAQKQQESLKATQDKMVAASTSFVTDSYKEEVIKAFPDFHAKVFNPNVVFKDPVVRHMIESSPQNYALAYRLASDDVLRARLNASSQVEAGVIIGDLQRHYAAPVNKKFKTKAPKAVPGIGNTNRPTSPKDEDLDIDSFLAKQDKKRAAEGAWG